MMTEQRSSDRAALHGHPSAAEIIAADYPEWEIHREREPDGHGDWVATRGRASLTASTSGGLLVRLEEQELARLQAQYGTEYCIVRTPNMWKATARQDGPTEPTIMRDTSVELEGALRAPAPRIGRWDPL